MKISRMASGAACWARAILTLTLVLSATAGVACAQRRANAGRGAGGYNLDGTTLEHTHADGRRARHTAFLMPREDNVLVIAGATYLKRENQRGKLLSVQRGGI